MLASCATRSSLGPDVAPPKPPAEVCAPVAAEPLLPDTAGLPQPVTQAEKDAMTAFLGWGAQWGDWGRALAARAQKTVSWCGAQVAPR